MMGKGKVYKIATWALLALNLAVLGFFLFIAPRPPRPRGAEGFRGRATEILHLDPAQKTQFIALAEAHNEKMKAFRQKQADLLRTYFEGLGREIPVEEQDQTLSEVLEMEKSKVEVTFAHFQEVKSMLRPEQKEYFKDFMNQALEMLLLESRGRRSPPPQAD